MRSHQLPTEFTHLSPEQLNSLHSWLDEFPYRVVLEKLQSEFQVKISLSKLCRYSQRREVADEISSELDTDLDIREFFNLLNANPVPYEDGTLHLINKRVFELLLRTPIDDLSPNKLLLLQRILTYKTNLALKQKDQELGHRRLALREMLHQPLTDFSPGENPLDLLAAVAQTAPQPPSSSSTCREQPDLLPTKSEETTQSVHTVVADSNDPSPDPASPASEPAWTQLLDNPVPAAPPTRGELVASVFQPPNSVLAFPSPYKSFLTPVPIPPRAVPKRLHLPQLPPATAILAALPLAA